MSTNDNKINDLTLTLFGFDKSKSLDPLLLDGFNDLLTVAYKINAEKRQHLILKAISNGQQVPQELQKYATKIQNIVDALDEHDKELFNIQGTLCKLQMVNEKLAAGAPQENMPKFLNALSRSVQLMHNENQRLKNPDAMTPEGIRAEGQGNSPSIQKRKS